MTAFTKVSILALFVVIAAGLSSVSANAGPPVYVTKKKALFTEKSTPSKPTEKLIQNKPSSTAADFAGRVAKACVSGKWEQQPCLKAVSENNLVMASNYMAALKEANKESHSEMVKEHCAASTAATRGEYPANAMRSAYVECVNFIVDTAQATGMLPDQSQYQLLVGAVQCLDKAQACSGIEQALSRYK